MPELVILTGVSGAGKSTALFAFEEMGYYCVENIPAPLLASMLHLTQTDARYKKTLIAVNISDAQQAIDEAKKIAKLKFKVLCLDCTMAALLARYKLTRHVHPLQTQGCTLEKAIAMEKDDLEKIRSEVDVMIDTSGFEVVDFRRKVFANFQKSKDGLMTVSFVSFGFKYGVPSDVDMILDTRILTNPFYIHDLKALTGQDEPVKKFLGDLPKTEQLLDQMTDYLDFYLEANSAESRPYFVIGIGCSGGQHRSVYIAERLAAIYEEKYNTVVNHRDLMRSKGL